MIRLTDTMAGVGFELGAGALLVAGAGVVFSVQFAILVAVAFVLPRACTSVLLRRLDEYRIDGLPDTKLPWRPLLSWEQSLRPSAYKPEALPLLRKARLMGGLTRAGGMVTFLVGMAIGFR